MIARWLNVICGLWIFFSAFWLTNIDRPFYLNNIVCGLVVAAVAIIAMTRRGEPLRWVNAVLGVWVIISAWVFAAGPAAVASNVILGVVVVIAASAENIYAPEAPAAPGAPQPGGA
jgi:hypothetical protein